MCPFHYSLCQHLQREFRLAVWQQRKNLFCLVCVLPCKIACTLHARGATYEVSCLRDGLSDISRSASDERKAYHVHIACLLELAFN